MLYRSLNDLVLQYGCITNLFFLFYQDDNYPPNNNSNHGPASPDAENDTANASEINNDDDLDKLKANASQGAAKIQFAVRNFSKIDGTVLSEPVYARNIPWYVSTTELNIIN